MEWPAFINERLGVIGALLLVIGLQHKAMLTLWQEVKENRQSDRNRIRQLEAQLSEALDLSKGNSGMTREAIALAHESVTIAGGGQEVAHAGPPT